MTLFLSSDDVRLLCSQDVAARAARTVLDAQASGHYRLPHRYDIDLPNGFFRMMPAAVGDYVGVKIMTLARGVGNRYLLALYSQQTGELIALVDAAEVTQLRTAATTAVAAGLLHPNGASHVGLIGTGFEAAGHLRALAHCWPLESVTVYSRSPEHRDEFADRMSAELGITVKPAADPAGVIMTSEVSMLCTKSKEPVIEGMKFARGATVLSIGSTRPDLRELDIATFARSAALLVDDPEQVIAESGDVAAAIAAGVLDRDRIFAMSEWSGATIDSDRDLLTFKSVGTAIQDLVLAAELVASARESGVGRELGELASLKRVPSLA